MSMIASTPLRVAVLAAFTVLVVGGPGATARETEHSEHGTAAGRAVTSSDGEPLGVVDFPTSCDPAAQTELERGLALVHHMN